MGAEPVNCEGCGLLTDPDDIADDIAGLCYDCAHDELRADDADGEVFLTDETFLESLKHPGAQRVTFDEAEEGADGR